ncbi:MAG: hypothetical protein COT73_09455 [Bdellovibrio sp. CG10_big_fil_rev_8_21_14_0_10_47_8]|nr:MAG: hypothetical protein COT73_09455 [Bdellovibrio sp. CG10_big_fil_rev_8_21_14_0_10_47_8]
MKHWIVYTLILASLTGCDRIKSWLGMNHEATSPVTAQENSPTAPAQESVVPQQCANNKEPQILTGKCTGQWKVVKGKKGDLNTCEFTWGPAISCPHGTQPLAQAQACTGGYAKRIRKDQAFTTGKECAANFGEFPKPPDYQLSCCPL